MANEQSGRERDLILAPNQFAFIQDETKGIISVYVGPNRTSLAGTDRPVVYDPGSRRFVRAQVLDEAVREFPLASEGWYIVLENPAIGDQPHPPIGSSQLPRLDFGRKVNMPGPKTFPLWPGQVARVIEGHRLRSNQYLVVRVYNEESARANWDRAVMKPVDSGSKPAGDGRSGESQDPSAIADKKDGAEAVPKSAAIATADLTIGKLLIIKGTDVSFYIPPTGVEVVPDQAGQYVRDAVTLERLEYCILLDENGAKRILKGPAVIFPSPTENFVERGGSRKHRAIELNDDMGIFVKVIADYVEDDKKTERKTGEELFITGKEMRIYYPREEHAIIRYGDQERHYGVAIPDGEARYVLDKRSGKVETIKGPRILLTDPRSHVIVRRVLEEGQVTLWFPNNTEAAEHNRRLREIVRRSSENSSERALTEETVSAAMPPVRRIVGQEQVAGDFQRGKSYTPPRSLTLDTKYEGAVAISVWTGYAVMIVNKAGARRVVVGPKTALLDYDETIQVLEMSTGKPKTTDKLERTAYLHVENNQVSDIVKVITRDMVEVEVKLSYRVNFEGDAERWFRVENYVKFLCDHMRSLLRHAVKGVGIEDFNNASIPLIRDTILGKSDGGKRVGKPFEENGMRVYDVEVLGIKIGDEHINSMLTKSQHDVVDKALALARRERELDTVRRDAEIQRQIDEVVAETQQRKLALDAGISQRRLEHDLERIAAEAKTLDQEMQKRLAEQEGQNQIDFAVRSRTEAERQLEQRFADLDAERRIKELQAEVMAAVEKAKAFTPDLIAALQAFGDKRLAGELSQSMAPLAILGGESVVDVARKLLSGTPIGKALETLGGNGIASKGSGPSKSAHDA